MQIDSLVLHSCVRMSLGLATAAPLWADGELKSLTFLLLSELVMQIECRRVL